MEYGVRSPTNEEGEGNGEAQKEGHVHCMRKAHCAWTGAGFVDRCLKIFGLSSQTESDKDDSCQEESWSKGGEANSSSWSEE